ncbi:hypothetical protein POPTR_016G122350v4 [Populus trichocarpa]|uniref:Uncharacterized protein n=2 Tax=Populus trichocarpa TaxID=3694 RepID=A0ACC0RUK6_POPTR|nr:kinetochore protein SPC24 homolog [Populus trichocarpa]ABK93784.1 unknown [Populus trichocarpa]KAI9380602.1 hypothetical protein POPTR_016G122350v4 [Populus trichocarpa]
MGDFSGKIDVEKLISFSDDLVAVLKDQRDINNLSHCLQQSHSLKSSCDAEFNDSKTLIEDYEKKIEECKKKTEKAKAEVVSDADMEILEQELEVELQKEAALTEELRVINNEISDLECQRVSFEERKRNMKKNEKDELRAERMLSMYASVTNIIPDLDDHSKISGHIVHRDNKAVEKFEFDPTKISSFEICQSIWEMINKQ